MLRTVLDLLDAVVELYLKSVIAPFLKLHEKIYAGFNKFLRQLLDQHNVPVWFTANFITYARTVLVFPTVLLLAEGYRTLPALLVLAVDVGDFLDGVVARYWVDQAKEKESKKQQQQQKSSHSRSSSPASSDKDSFGAYLLQYDIQKMRPVRFFLTLLISKQKYSVELLNPSIN